MKTISRYIMTLALLLTAVTGAWAITDPNAVYWDNQTTWYGWTDSETTHTVGDITITCSGNAKAYEIMFSGEPLALQAGANDAITFTSNGKPFASIKISMYDNTDPGLAGWTWDNGYNVEWSGTPSTSVTLSGCNFAADNITFTFGTAEAPIAVEPVTGQQNQWTFTMPGSDVVLTPIYAKAAAFATTGTEPEVKTLLPEAAEGVIAGTDASLIAEGTGIVALAGESTEATQGTLMYAIGTSATEAPALTAFSATVPTAQNVADDGADVLVWYYIQGADAPQGEAATLDNTFSDTEPACLTVQVLTNKFDIQLNAANANTIEAGKATVTVAGAAATVTDGKLQGVKMGSEVKLEAKPGYKFRKVEVKKKAEVTYPLLSATTTDDIGKVVCAAGHLHDAKTAVPDGCTAVGILAKVTETGHGLILALKDATSQNWNTINGWTSASYAGTTLKVLPDDDARGTNLTSYTTLGETAVSNWAVGQKSDYEAIFTNLGSTVSDSYGTTYDDNVNAYITDAGGTAITGGYWSTSYDGGNYSWIFSSEYWDSYNMSNSLRVRPVLGF